MKTFLVASILACAIAGLWAGAAGANRQVSDDVTMAVAPSTLLLGMEQSDVTVHTSIPFAAVDTASLTMEGLTPLAVFADACGDLVARFDEYEVKAIVAAPEATLTLTGLLVNGEPLSLSDTIQVK